MKAGFVRTSLDIPKDVHRRLHETAARRGCSARQIILAGIESAIGQSEPERPPRRLNLEESLIPPAGRVIGNLTNEEIYDLIDFP